MLLSKAALPNIPLGMSKISLCQKARTLSSNQTSIPRCVSLCSTLCGIQNSNVKLKERVKYHGFYGYYKGQMVQEPPEVRPPPLWLKDLECARKLGRPRCTKQLAYQLTFPAGTGAYGSVLLVRVRPRVEGHQIDRPGSVFALKVLQKVDIQNFDKVCMICIILSLDARVVLNLIHTALSRRY